MKQLAGFLFGCGLMGCIWLAVAVEPFLWVPVAFLVIIGCFIVVDYISKHWSD